MNVVCVGDCGIDHYLPTDEIFCGGITANFALQARAAFPEDDSITIISAIGNDAAAAVVDERLKGSRIDCHIASLEGTTSVQYIEIQPDGERYFAGYDEGVLRDYRIDEEAEKLIAASDLLVVPIFRQIYDFFRRVISIDHAGLTAVDFADFAEYPEFSLLEMYLDAIDIGFFGLSVEDESLIEKIRRLAAARNKLFVVTLGADGSRAFQGGDAFGCAAVPVDKIVDTTGAGDAFAAGFLGHYCSGGNVSASLMKGAALSARIIQRVGGN